MSGFDCFLVAWWVVSLLAVVSMVGKPRGPIESRTAVTLVAVYVAFIAGLLWSRGVL